MDEGELTRLLESAWEALERGEVKAAARALESARAAAGPHDPDVLALEVELALEHDDADGALDAYEHWMAAAPSDPAPLLGAAELHAHERGDIKTARRLLEQALERFALERPDEADARHLLGLIDEALGDDRKATREWLRVLELDAAADDGSGPPLLSDAEIEAVAQAALDELPDELLARLGNVPVLLDDRPSPELVRDGVDPRLLGLFTGLSMDSGSVLGRSPAGVIQLFRRNLELDAADAADLAAQVRITVIHETAHYFGADEDDLRRLGLD